MDRRHGWKDGLESSGGRVGGEGRRLSSSVPRAQWYSHSHRQVWLPMLTEVNDLGVTSFQFLGENS